MYIKRECLERKKRGKERLFDVLESRGSGVIFFAFCRFRSVGGDFLCILDILIILYDVFFSPLLDRGERRKLKWEIKKNSLKIEQF